MQLGNPPSLQLQDFTIEAWIKRGSATVANADGSGFGTALFFSHGGGGYGFGIENGGNLFLTRVEVDNVTLNTGVTDTNWHHVAVTKAGTTVFFYIDGVAHSVPTYNTTYNFSSGAAIGARGDNLNSGFFGAIDELAVYNRALSAAEVQSIYSASSAGKCSQSQTCVPGPSGLVTWWQGAGNALDSVDSNHGTLVGNTTYAPGKVGQAFSFDGSGDAVRVGNPASLQLQDFTIEAWIRRSSASQPSLETSGGLFFAYGGGGYVFGLLDDGHLFLGAVGVSAITSTAQITDTIFHHVAVTKVGSTVFFYVDGVAYAAPSYSPGFTFGSQAAIGARGDNSANSFLGVIDELDVFNRALTALEVQSIYNAGAVGKCGIGPSITSQPTNQTVTAGANVTFTVAATGASPLSYQWRFNTTNIAGAINATLTLTNLQLADGGNYSVVVSNSVSSVTSSNAILTVNPASTCAQSPPGLVSWWQGAGNALDGVDSNHGTLVGNTTYGPGKVGQAFSFDGSGDAVRVGNPASLQLQDFTIEAWIRRSSASQPSLETSGGLFFAYGGGGYVFGLLDDGHLFLGAVGVSAITSTAQITDTIFHHVAVTKVGSTVFFYVDGVAYAAPSYSPGFTFGSQAAIGARGDNSANSFLGVIDELDVFNRALNALEVQNIYNAGSTGKCPPPIFVSSFTNGSFELPPQPTGLGQALPPGSTAITGWTVGNLAGMGWQNGPSTGVNPVEGNQHIGFNGGNAAPGSFIFQTFNTIVGQTYAVSFYVGRAGGGGGAMSLLAAVTSSSNAVLGSLNAAAPGSPGYGVVQSFTFTATTSTSTLTFTDTSSATVAVDVLLDSVLVVPVSICTSSPPGLVSWWQAESNTLDANATNHGTLVGNAAFVAGRVGQALSFDGSGDAVSVGNPASLQLQDFTIEAWIKRGSATVANADGSGAGTAVFFSHGGGGYGFGIENGGNLFLSRIGVDNVTLSTGITDTNWHHVAVTKSGSTVFFYIDGAAHAVPVYNTTYNFSSGAAIGARGDNFSSGFFGAIDELAIYNRALSAGEIQSIYSASSTGKCGIAPSIASQPASKSVPVGVDVTFRVVATGSSPLGFQWRLNTTNIIGATNATLNLTNVQFGDAGNYSVVVNNGVSSVTSSNASLTVNPTVCFPAPSGLISWWPAEGNALDTGTNNGTLAGNATYATGLSGQAFSFDGSGDGVSLGNPSSLRLQTFTIDAWIRRNNSTQPSQGPAEGIFFGYGGGGYAFGLKNDGRLFLTRNGVSQVISTAQITDTGFHHVAVTKVGSTVVFYVDGVAYPASNYNATFTFTSNAAIGAEGGLGSGFWGAIDELDVFNRALSTNEIQSIYFAGSSGKCGLAPSILTPPQGRSVNAGTNVTFNVVAAGTPPLSYQWQLNTTNILGATNSSLVLSNAQAAHVGSYTVVVSNSVNSVTSAPANLKVIYVLAFGNGQPLTNSQHSFVDSVSIQLQTLLTNGTLFYTLDGSTPSFASPQYLGPFQVNQSSFLRVVTYSADFFQFYEADAIALIIIPTYTITATTPGGGSISFNPTNSSYASNTLVTVTATPTNGWTFMAWQGDASGTNPVVNLLMNTNKLVQAIFGTTLGTTVAGSGAVTVIPSVPLYPYGTLVQLYATPQTGNYFALWGNAASGSSNPLNFTVNSANPTVSSLFASLSTGQFALTVVPNGSGQVTVSPQTNRYSSGQNVTVTAIPDAGQQFMDWSGDASGTSNPLQVTMTGSKVITANFTQSDLLEPGPQRLNSQGFHLTLTGELGGQYRVDGSTNLLDWTELFTVFTLGPVPLIDSAATNTSLRFYRAVKVP